MPLVSKLGFLLLLANIHVVIFFNIFFISSVFLLLLLCPDSGKSLFLRANLNEIWIRSNQSMCFSSQFVETNMLFLAKSGKSPQKLSNVFPHVADFPVFSL